MYSSVCFNREGLYTGGGVLICGTPVAVLINTCSIIRPCMGMVLYMHGGACIREGLYSKWPEQE